MSWGVLYRKGGPPKKLVLWVSSKRVEKMSEAFLSIGIQRVGAFLKTRVSKECL